MGGIIWSVWSLYQMSSVGILDFEVGYSKELVNEYFTKYGVEGLEIYRRVQYIDIINPAVYGLLLLTLTYRFTKAQLTTYTVWAILALVFFDYLENILLFRIVNAYPVINEFTIGASSTLSYIKHLSMVAVIITVSWNIYLLKKGTTKQA